SVLITGTSKGIGLETALAFARAGHQVYATMRNPSQSPALAETAAREKLPITISKMDVDSDQSVSNAIAAIQKNGPIDVLVNNAGIEGVGPVEEFPLAIMETNYFGALRCIQAVVPEMRQRRSGTIINVSSVAGRICPPPLTSYCASKWALEALSEGLAGELKTFNLRVAIVEPGIIDTSMAQRIGDPAPGSPYGQTARFSALYSKSLEHPVPPSLVAEKNLEVAQSDSWQLRYPVGPDAVGFLEWRKGMSDEEWIEMNAGDDESFFAKLSEAG
ncbi:MAG TPA: SDR family oxidoreductase, partial [Edaphobacter sp.]|nr:SDR family oxidoreductase [Edaphobacter sp.]